MKKKTRVSELNSPTLCLPRRVAILIFLKLVFGPNFWEWKSSPHDVKKILRELRFNPSEMRLKLRKTGKMTF